LKKKIREYAPSGIDTYFDNVGGEQLQAALNTMKHNGKVLLCGQASTYRTGGFSNINLLTAVLKDISLHGFLVLSYSHLFGEAINEMSQMLAEGKLHNVVDVQTGFENLPKTFGLLWKSKNVGKLILKV